HQLEDVATTFFGVRLSSGRFESLVRDVRRTTIDGEARKASVQRAAFAVERAAQGMFSALQQKVPGSDARRAIVRADLEGPVAVEAQRLDDALTGLAAELEDGAAHAGAAIAARRTRDLLDVLRAIQRGVGRTDVAGEYEE